ncbi:MAG: hypothetical protein GY941_00915 [Planctomycetes bacterium]|nr:hypothetical protein [Planctomycetota bacterium]
MKRVFLNMSAFSAGFYFATCQVGYFLHMEFNLSSSFVSYYVVIGLWIIGCGGGLMMSLRGLGPLLLLSGLSAFYLHSLILRRYPYDMHLMPIYMLLILLSALYSGYFFRHVRKNFRSVKVLFFHENNGFLCGYIVAVTELLLYGQFFQHVLPSLAAFVHLILVFVSGRVYSLEAREYYNS